jgi:hypothetical protein
MRLLLAISVLALTLALALTVGGAQFGSHLVQVGGSTHLLAGGGTPDGWTCGGSVGTPC